MSDSTKTQSVIAITDSAIGKIRELIDSRERGELAVRVVLRGRLPGGGFQSEFKFVGRDDLKPSDVVQDTGKFKLYFDRGCAASIRGATVDFDERRYPTGFHIEYPPQIAANPASWKHKEWAEPVAIAVQNVIDEHINPGIAAHGGWVMLQDVIDDAAIVEMGGGCQGCGLSEVTLRQGIERLILQHVPEIRAVIDHTEHEAGTNPYYSPAKGGDPEADSPLAGEE
ncbi:MAG: NifU family protein [Chloroflexi bacterium]|nr:NifU family protein [Chloroflexota bacterium]